ALATGEWNDQFTGKSATEKLVVVKGTPQDGGNEIQAITGSTITSRAVIEGVNTAIAVYQNMSK
ncbi:MAG: FMN-binding protein, partial [Acetobacterium sp.]|nr:FMN-binding protein [Acetobacterium sp.]